MKDVSIAGVHSASQMLLGLETNHDAVVLALEAPLDATVVDWLAYGASPGRAREIAGILLHAADVIEGKQVDDGRYDANIVNFKDHHAR